MVMARFTKAILAGCWMLALCFGAAQTPARRADDTLADATMMVAQ